ncbi:helix-turn-helix domain-containing protein [Streptomyces sp. NPDC048415]|uniref:helix-turn-helix domain-containing protein n=1 Tax=Streptomyces sp. NPDC048415 TaxID=3154822 RepID=UPI003437A2FB
MATGIVSRAGHGPGGSWETALALPHPRLRPVVISYRGIRLALDGPRRRLETPIGAATLLLGFEQPVRISRLGRPPVTLVSVFSGPTTTAAVGEHAGRLSGIEVLLAPWAAFTLFSTPQYELADRTVDPDELPHLPCRPRRLEKHRRTLRRAGRVAGLAGAVRAARRRAHALGRGGNAEFGAGGAGLGPPPADLGCDTGAAARRRSGVERTAVGGFREQIGLGPKAAARVLRLQRARRLLAAGRSQAETAAVCGYYDQAHLSGEFKAMTGCTPREFTAARGTESVSPPGPPGDSRLAGEATSLVLLGDRSGRSAIFSKTGGTR